MMNPVFLVVVRAIRMNEITRGEIALNATVNGNPNPFGSSRL
jgi:hypothetical protein